MRFGLAPKKAAAEVALRLRAVYKNHTEAGAAVGLCRHTIAAWAAGKQSTTPAELSRINRIVAARCAALAAEAKKHAL